MELNKRFIKLNPPSITIKNIDVDGRYYVDKHSIELNSKNVSKVAKEIKKLIQSKNIEKTWNELQLDKNFANIYSYIFPASTLIHELTHAWIGSNEAATSHADLTVVVDKMGEKAGLGKEGEKLNLTFNDAANLIFKVILANGFLKEISNQYIILNN